jgi:hypothetical protein
MHFDTTMSQAIRFLGGALLAATGAICACGGATQSAAANGTPSHTTLGVTNAVSCNNVGGAHTKYGSIDACLDDIRVNMSRELNGYDCPGGIDQGALDRCMDAIRAEGCDRPLDTLSRFDKCSTANLCMKEALK